MKYYLSFFVIFSIIFFVLLYKETIGKSTYRWERCANTVLFIFCGIVFCLLTAKAYRLF